MEQKVRFTGPAGQLEGVLDLPDAPGPVPAIVMCHPHPQYGGSMVNNVVFAVCAAARRHGIASLRFNFRGIGESEGRYDGGEGERDDLRAALRFFLEQPQIDRTRVALGGYSFGAGVAMRTVGSLPEVRALALVSLPLRSAEGGLAGVEIPKLFIAGGEDNAGTPAAVQAFAAGLTGPVEVKGEPNADHFWVGQESFIVEAAGTFLATYLVGQGKPAAP